MQHSAEIKTCTWHIRLRNKYIDLQSCMCVRRVCSWIFKKVTREILTVYKEGAYRSIGVCIFNRFCTFPSSGCKKPMKLLIFAPLLLFSYWGDYLDRQIEIKCFPHTVRITNSLSSVYLKQNLSDSSLATSWTTYICFEGVPWNIWGPYFWAIVLWDRIHWTDKRLLAFVRPS